MVSTNLLGSIFGSRAAMRVMEQQPSPGGKIFLMDGQVHTHNPRSRSASERASQAFDDDCVPF